MSSYFWFYMLFSYFKMANQLPNGVEVTIKPDNSNTDWVAVFDKSPLIPLHKTENKIYYVGKYFRATFLQANLFCNLMRMRLLTISSKDINQEITNVLQNNNITGDFWTSGTRLLDGTSWIWMATAEPVKFKNWGPGQPNNDRDHCILITKTSSLIWNDRNCNCRFYFICEKVPEESLFISHRPEFSIRKFYRTYFD